VRPSVAAAATDEQDRTPIRRIQDVLSRVQGRLHPCIASICPRRRSLDTGIHSHVSEMCPETKETEPGNYPDSAV
jgi:hypothetical protein